MLITKYSLEYFLIITNMMSIIKYLRLRVKQTSIGVYNHCNYVRRLKVSNGRSITLETRKTIDRMESSCILQTLWQGNNWTW